MFQNTERQKHFDCLPASTNFVTNMDVSSVCVGDEQPGCGLSSMELLSLHIF